jgi:hypothetical protein
VTEKAKRCANLWALQLGLHKGLACGFRLAGAQYDGRRSRACAGLAFTGGATQGPSAPRSKHSSTIRKERIGGSASDGKEAGSGVPESDSGTSEVDTVWSKLHEVPKRPRGVSILGAEKASVEWCAGSCAAEADDSE